jgi:predicted RNA-binding Zn-ribbon protein involved in translation (DUF1610 family)
MGHLKTFQDHFGDKGIVKKEGATIGICPACKTRSWRSQRAWHRVGGVKCPKCGEIMLPSQAAQEKYADLSVDSPAEQGRRCIDCKCFLNSYNLIGRCFSCQAIYVKNLSKGIIFTGHEKDIIPPEPKPMPESVPTLPPQPIMPREQSPKVILMNWYATNWGYRVECWLLNRSEHITITIRYLDYDDHIETREIDMTLESYLLALAQSYVKNSDILSYMARVAYFDRHRSNNEMFIRLRKLAGESGRLSYTPSKIPIKELQT